MKMENISYLPQSAFALVLLFQGANYRVQAQIAQQHLKTIFEYIQDSEYEIRTVEDQGLYKIANRAQNLRYTLEANKLAIEPRDYGKGKSKPWDATFHFDGLAKGAGRIPFGNPSWEINLKHAQASDQNVVIEYQNGTEGLRQNFWILAPPRGADPLMLEFTVVAPALKMKVQDTELRFSDVTGRTIFSYSDLNVWDANEQRLDAALVSLPGNRFAIVLDDSRAAYPIFVDPLISVAANTENTSGIQYGYSVWGRVTYFGYDVVVGAPNYDTGAYVDAGKVFGYIGILSGTHLTPTWTKEGDQNNGRFGWSVAGGFDFDGDGTIDYAVGAPYYDAGGYTDNGKVWVYQGAGVGGASSTVIFENFIPMGGALFGYALTFVPDVSGDGISELAIGAAAYDTVSATAAGAAFLYFGGSTPDTTADWTVYGTSSYAQFGYSLAHAANIKGDGDAALAVGAPFDSTGGLSKGSVSLFYKSGSNLSTTPAKLWGESSGDRFGFSVAAGKDQDGNGNTDLLVGAPYYSNGQSHEGRAYLFRGTASGINSTASWTVESDQANAETGFSVAIGDIDGDGKADLLVGSPHYSTTSSSQVDNGIASSFVTNESGAPTLDASVSGYQNYDHCGSSVAFVEADGIAGRPSAWIVGSPDAHATDGSLTGGTATIWQYLPAVSITVQDGTAIESPPHSGIFRITRAGRTGSDLVVNYTSGGTAICSPSFDYNFYEGGTLKDSSGSFTIPAGSSFVDIEVRPYADFVSEGSETAILILASSSSYKIGTPSSGTVNIFDVPPP